MILKKHQKQCKQKNTIINHIQKENKKKSFENLSLLHHGHSSTTRKNLLRRFKYYYKRLHVVTKRDCIHRQSEQRSKRQTN